MDKKYFYLLAFVLVVSIFIMFKIKENGLATSWPKIKNSMTYNEDIEKNIADLLEKMTLEEKVAQMIQGEIKFTTPQDVKEYRLGSVLNGGGSFPYGNKNATQDDWLRLSDAYYEASIDTSSGGVAIPIIWGTDAVHGHNNVKGATLFPHNIGLGAANNPELIKKIARATASEVLATGIKWIFAPTVAVAKNDRWGRTYESYSDDPLIVKNYAQEFVTGLQGSVSHFLGEKEVLSTVKHFIGDGGTFNGIDQGDTKITEDELLSIHGQGYISGLNAGAQVVMASFNSWNGQKVHGHHYLITEVLKNKMGFEGFVVGDWNGHGQVENCNNSSCPQAINAGIDMIMVPEDWKAFYHNTIKQVKDGIIPLSRINDAVTRILRVKYKAGLFNKLKPSENLFAKDKNIIGSKEHRNLARQAVRESLVLLKNNNQLLPLKTATHILVTGKGAHNIGMQAGGWSISWQGTGNKNEDFPGSTSVFQALISAIEEGTGLVEISKDGSYQQKPDVAIVVFGEDPYAEGQGDLEHLSYHTKYPDALRLLKRYQNEGIKTVSLFLSGRPLWVNPELNHSDAFIAAWLPGTEALGITDLIIQDEIKFDFKGRLSFDWPNSANNPSDVLFNRGYGLSLRDNEFVDSNLSVKAFTDLISSSNNIYIFESRSISPFQSFIYNKTKGIYKLPGDVGSSGGVKVVASDKDIQEDARVVIFKEGELNRYYFQNVENKKIDIKNNINFFLRFDLNVLTSVSSKINLLFNEFSYDLTSFFREQNGQGWQTVAIELNCFSPKIDNVLTGFGIETNGDLKVAIANIVITDIISEHKIIKCTN